MRPIIPESRTRQFTGKIIWSAESIREHNQYVAFRRKFTMEKAGECRIFISADTYYNLHIDGMFIHRGPARAYETNYSYDELSFLLEEGVHQMAVLVHYIGKECATHRVASKAFFADILTDDGIIGTDESFKAMYLKAYRDTPQMISHFGFPEDVDMREYPIGWTEKNYNDSLWPEAEVISEVGKDCHVNLTARQLKLFNYVFQKSEIIYSGYSVFNHTRNEKVDNMSGSCKVGDFRISCSGTAEIHYENVSDGDELLVSYDDMITSSKTVNPARNTSGFTDRFILSKGNGVVRGTMTRGFRYIMADLEGVGSIKEINAQKEEYPYNHGISFVSSDETLNIMHEQSVRTQQICTIDGFTDCVTRERVLWLGDAYMDCLGNYYSEPDKGLLLDTIYKHAHSQKENGSLGGYTMTDLNPDWICMVSYDMMWLHMLMDYVLFTGDLKSLMPLNDTIIRLLEYLEKQKNSDGIIDTALGGSGFWEWGFSELDGQLLMSNAYYIFTIDRMYHDPFFRTFVTDEQYEKTKQMKTVCRTLFFDEGLGVYKDAVRPDGSKESLHSQTANAFAILSGICDSSYQKKLAEKILDHNNSGPMAAGERPHEIGKSEPDYNLINPVSSMYSAMFVCQALFSNDFHEEALSFMREIWGPFADLPTLPELIENGENNTMCHGWSGAPAFILPMYVLGLRPLSSGWKQTIFMPPVLQGGQLKYVKGTVKTPFGEIKAQWVRAEAGMKLTVSIPEGISMKLIWNKKEITCDNAGEYTVYIPD